MSKYDLSQRAAAARPLDDSPVPPHLLCNSCSKPLFNGFQTPHGCRLCQRCVTDLLPPSERRRCPGNTEACRDENDEIDVSQATCFADMATRREVARLQVLCPNCNAGCRVTLAWGQVDAHLESCHFQTLTCELCNEHVMKSDLQHHMANECNQRHIRCDLCSQSLRFCDINTKHRNLQSDACCAAFAALCPHCGDRGGRLDRRAYMLHLTECPESPAACKYSHLGCGAKLRRSDLEQHYRDSCDSHLELVEARLKRVQTLTVQTAVDASAERRMTFDADLLQTAHSEITGLTYHFSRRFSMILNPAVHLHPGQPISADCPVRPTSPSQLFTCLGFWPGHSDRVTAVCHVKDIRLVATGGGDGTVLLWDEASGHLQLRMRAPQPWGSVTGMSWLSDGVLLVAWQRLCGLLRLRTVQFLLPNLRGPDAAPLKLTEVEPAFLRCQSPVVVIADVPGATEAAIAFADGNLALVASVGDPASLSGLDANAAGGPVCFLQIPEPGRLLMRQLHRRQLVSARLCRDLPGAAVVSGIRTIDLPDLPSAAAPIRAWPVGEAAVEASVVFVCESARCACVARIGSDGFVRPGHRAVCCHSSDVTAVRPLTTDATGGLCHLATASVDGGVRVWRAESGGGGLRMLQVSFYQHVCEVTFLELLPGLDGALWLVIGDAEGNCASVRLQL